MIYGKITLEDWRTVCVEGEEPESSFESYNLRLFFFGTLYNRDTLQATPDDTNAKLADLETTINRVILFKTALLLFRRNGFGKQRFIMIFQQILGNGTTACYVEHTVPLALQADW